MGRKYYISLAIEVHQSYLNKQININVGRLSYGYFYTLRKENAYDLY